MQFSPMLAFARSNSRTKSKIHFKLLQKDAAKLFCKLDGMKKIIIRKSKGATKEEDFRVLEYHEGDLHKKNKELGAPQNHGFTNSHAHLKVTCKMVMRQSL